MNTEKCEEKKIERMRDREREAKVGMKNHIFCNGKKVLQWEYKEMFKVTILFAFNCKMLWNIFL